MSNTKVEIAKAVAQVLQTLPEDKQVYLLGFLEGIAAITTGELPQRTRVRPST